MYIYIYIHTHTVNSIPLLLGGGAVPRLWMYDEMKVENGKAHTDTLESQGNQAISSAILPYQL